MVVKMKELNEKNLAIIVWIQESIVAVVKIKKIDTKENTCLSAMNAGLWINKFCDFIINNFEYYDF